MRAGLVHGQNVVDQHDSPSAQHIEILFTATDFDCFHRDMLHAHPPRVIVLVLGYVLVHTIVE